MHLASRAFVLAVLAAVSLAAFTAVSAQTPTPTPTPTPSPTPTATPTPSPTPTPTPTPSPVPTSTITIRFVRDGEPVTIDVLFTRIFADGVQCLFPDTERWKVSVLSRTWPLPPWSSQPPECSKGPPTILRFEFGGLFIEFLWTGGDVTMDIEVPPEVPVFATPTPTPAPPEELPITGGTPGEGPGEAGWVFLLIAGTALGVLSLTLIRFHRR